MAENKPKEIRYNEILDAAMKCFTEKGRHNTRIDDIARESNLTKGGIYWHFKDKREIYLAMIEKHLHEDMEFWKEILAEEEMLPDSITKAGISYLRYAMQNKRHIYLHAEMFAESFRDKVLKKKLNDIHLKWKMLISDFFKIIIMNMTIEQDNVPVEEIACILLSCIEGMTHQYWLSGDDVDIDYYENAWITFSKLLLKGLRE